MRVIISVSFEVEGMENDELDSRSAEYAAELAVFHHAVFTANGINISGDATVNVDGYGKCLVRIVGEE